MKKKSLLYLFLFFVAVALFVAWNIFGPTTKATEGKYFFIHTGSTYNEVKEELKSKNILSGTLWFDKVSSILGYPKSVKAGRYRVDAGTSIWSLVRMLKGGRQSPVNFVINRIRTREELAHKLADNFELDSSSVMEFLNNPDTLSKYHADTNTIFTVIISNTYTFNWNTPLSKIFRKFSSEQQKFWNTKRKEEAANLHLTPKEVYILASIVEEETNAESDKGKIASVYINRMNSGMSLSADPTVKFAMRDFGLRRILTSYTRIASPYNTYINKGLPPGPICTPSVKTIDAVLNAPETNYLYFVARPDFSGLSSFAQSFEEHKKNAVIYQHWLDSLFVARKLNMDGSASGN